MKSILGIINTSPTGNSRGHEAVEMLMVYAAFGFDVTILLRGAGVLHLQKDQQPEVIKLKNHSKLFAALDLYEVRKLLVDQQAVADYQCNPAENIHFDLIAPENIIEEIQQHTEVINF